MSPSVISRDRIARWAREAGASIELPDLVARLLAATNPSATVVVRTGTGVWLPGIDLSVRSTVATPFCPEGVSVWELSKDPSTKKRNADFATRAAEARAGKLEGFDPHTTTYVALTAGVATDKQGWAEAKAGEGPWAAVRLLDADDLALWLRAAPVASRWFARALGIDPDGLWSLDEFLALWIGSTTRHLPRELLLVGKQRELAADRVREWAGSPNAEPLYIRAASVREACAFAAAALLADTSAAPPWSERVLVAATPAAYAWARAGEAGAPLIVLPAFAAFDPEDLPLPASSTRVVVPLVASSSIAPDIVLDRVPPRDLFERWIDLGSPPEDLLRLVSQSAGDLPSLRVLLGAAKLPDWSKEPSEDLLTMLLVGSWVPTSQRDCAMLERLGSDEKRMTALCRAHSVGPESPLIEAQGDLGIKYWRWRAPGAAWALLAPRLTVERVQSFCALVREVFVGVADRGRGGSSDDTEPSSPSGRMALGLAATLARLATSPKLGAAQAVEGIVSEALAPSWPRWEALARLLPTLAEAAPDAFLRCVRASLARGEDGVSHLLARERRSGSAPHTHLLWALETLAWDKDRLLASARALATLAARDLADGAPGKIANRPFASLGRALDFEYGETNASREQRVRVVERLLVEEREIGFAVLLDQLPQYLRGLRLTQNRVAEINDRLQAAAWESRTSDDGSSSAAVVAQMAVRVADADCVRWAALIDRCHALPPEAESVVVEGLEAALLRIESGHAPIVNALRAWIAWDGRRADRRPGHLLETRRAMYERLQPTDWLGRFAWLFGERVDLPDGSGDFYADQALLERLRLEALEALPGDTERWPLLASVAQQPGAYALGELLTKVSFCADVERGLLVDHPSEDLAGLACAFAGARAVSEPSDWTRALVLRWTEGGRRDDAVAVLLRLPATPAHWELVDSLSPELSAAYWSKLGHFTVEEPAAATRALRRLLDNANDPLALRLAGHHAPSLPSPILVEVLEHTAAAWKRLRDSEGSTMLSHYVDRILGVVAKRKDVDRAQVAVAELTLLRVLDPLHHPPRFLSEYFADPVRFVAILDWAFASVEDGEEDGWKARFASEVLYAWRDYPGVAEAEPSVRARIAEHWARAVLAQTQARPYARAAEAQVMEVLARMPAEGPDPIWPNVVARRLVEEDGTGDRAAALRIAKFNARGTAPGDAGEPGQRQRTFAAEALLQARMLADDWPCTADMLRALAGRHASMAEESREGADGGRHLVGVEVAVGLLAAMLPQDDPAALAEALRVPPATVRHALARLTGVGVAEWDTARVDPTALLNQLRKQPPAEHRLPEGDDVVGVKTGIGTTSLHATLPLEGGARDWVWPVEGGSDKGLAVEPLCPGVPSLSQRSPDLHEVFALYDVVRHGRPRERLLAIDALRRALARPAIRTSAA